MLLPHELNLNLLVFIYSLEKEKCVFLIVTKHYIYILYLLFTDSVTFKEEILITDILHTDVLLLFHPFMYFCHIRKCQLIKCQVCLLFVLNLN